MSTDPAKRQYFIFALIISFLFSFILNFFFSGLLEGPFIGGFPIDVSDASGFSGFISRTLNTIIVGGLFSVPIYYALLWVQDRT